jgi:hypothetical protein
VSSKEGAAREPKSRTFKALAFHDAVPRFREGTRRARSYLEQCIETIKEREPIDKAFVA